MQIAVWLVGVAIFVALLGAPTIGLHAFWNVLIPVAPAVVVFVPGVWRNVCPLASTALFSRKVGLFSRRTGESTRRKVPYVWQGRLLLSGVVLLFALVPLRHIVFDLNGPATALLIAALAAVAVFMGAVFEWKSGWCSGTCPVHAVERLYGSAPVVVPRNAHCTECFSCTQPCVDSTADVGFVPVPNGRVRGLARTLMIGGFPGFVWGWFQVPDYAGAAGWSHAGIAYAYPLLGAAATLAVYRLAGRRANHWFAAAAVACYYWYRLPALFGWGPFPGDGMLVDMTGIWTAWFPFVSRAVTTALFAWWLGLRKSNRRGWLVRPARVVAPA